jgi:hypothetical protein
MPRRKNTRVVHSSWKNKGTIGHKKNRTKMNTSMNVNNIKVSSGDKLYLNGTIYTGEANYSKIRKYTTGSEFTSKSVPLKSGKKINSKVKNRKTFVMRGNNSKDYTETPVSKKYNQLMRNQKRYRFRKVIK